MVTGSGRPDVARGSAQCGRDLHFVRVSGVNAGVATLTLLLTPPPPSWPGLAGSLTLWLADSPSPGSPVLAGWLPSTLWLAGCLVRARAVLPARTRFVYVLLSLSPIPPGHLSVGPAGIEPATKGL